MVNNFPYYITSDSLALMTPERAVVGSILAETFQDLDFSVVPPFSSSA